MSDLLWSFDQLARFTRYEDVEVRYWAADRLAVLFPADAPDAIAHLILDDHDATPELVAEHLGRHGDKSHVPALLKGLRRGAGLLPGRCVEALARLGFEDVPALAEAALHQRDIPEGSLGLMVLALAEMGASGHARAADVAREFLLRRPELFAEPPALHAAARLLSPEDFPDLAHKWITALHFRGLDPVEAGVRALLDELQLEECGWCVRTDLSGRIDLERTLRAVESGYDLDVRQGFPPAARKAIAERLREGTFSEIAAGFGRYIQSAAAQLPAAPSDPLPARLAGLGKAFQDPRVLDTADKLGPALHQWIVGLLISGSLKVSAYRNLHREMEAAGARLQPLLELAGAESSCLLAVLPGRIAQAVKAEGGAARGRAVEWCLRMLEARGPFFPKAAALETLGELDARESIPEVAAHLDDDNAFIYHAAERALGRLGPGVVEQARAALASPDSHPDALQSLVRIACEMSHESSLRLLLEAGDEILDRLGPEAASECAGLLGRQEMVPHLRRWLERSPAMVGHSLLLIGAINNLPIPEEESILKAIDDYWKGSNDGAEGGPSGSYVM
ncbi:MAG TPA: hypothetical protein VJV23_00560 [Candidatus Polarisedimenticolia bacterium]|nr:hypothetical protein [Candidatus Polarisedimenticolia bacterium]